MASTIKVDTIDTPDGTGSITLNRPLITASGAGAGKIVQVVNVTDHTLSTTTATIPQDNTTPQNTEGLELFTLAITPTSASNKLLILADVNMANTGAIITSIVALF